MNCITNVECNKIINIVSYFYGSECNNYYLWLSNQYCLNMWEMLLLDFFFSFNAICNRVFNLEKFNLQRKVIVTLYQLEKYFPPSFFDTMVHLVVHLVRNIKLYQLIYLRWLCLFELYMKILKGYVRNQHDPKNVLLRVT